MNKLQSIGLIDITTKTQKKNGTQCYYDPIMDCDYLSYTSGYVRRAYTRATYYSPNLHRTIYQLNLTRKGYIKSSFSDAIYETTVRMPIMEADKRIDRLAHCAIVYRKNNSK